MGGDTLEVEYDYYLKLAQLYDTIDLNCPWDWRNQIDMPSSKAQRVGSIAETKFITECLERDFEPHVPTTPMPWDFIVTCPAGIKKVQVKSTNPSIKEGNNYSITCATGRTKKVPMVDEVDIVACYIFPEDTWFIIPRVKITACRTIRLSVQKSSRSRYKPYQSNWGQFYEKENNSID